MKLAKILIIISLVFLSACSNDDTKKSVSGDPIARFMTLYGNKQYDELTQTFSQELSDFWNKSSISQDIIEIRESLGDTWNPDETNFMNWQTPQGPIIQKAFKLQEDFSSHYTISFTTKVFNKNEKLQTLLQQCRMKRDCQKKSSTYARSILLTSKTKITL